ncbi:MAG: GspH/FimT family pseudopilin [Syntrophales bacterium]
MKTLKKNGFSLLELMIVIALMGIISAIAAPKLADYMAERRLRGAARMVMSDLMMARQRAVSQNNPFRVTFNGDHRTYTILDDDNGNGISDPGEASETKDIRTDYYDVTISNASANPTFSSRGAATLATTVTLTSSRTGGSRYVKVASTGRVMIDTAP